MTLPVRPHQPGSFTKNWGWHGQGLFGLHEAIRIGFGGNLVTVTRTDWRAACGLTNERFLIAANFFLFNIVERGKNTIPVDEFVRQAVMVPHSTNFDRLGLFVLNLSLGGKRSGSINGMEFPAAWSNDYVRQTLWQGGRWHSTALSELTVDAALSSSISAEPESIVKIRNNYRGIFEQAKFLPVKQPEINTSAEAWIAAALFTAWDRRTMAAGQTSIALRARDLVAESQVEEDYKLLGIALEEFQVMAPPVAEQYAAAGGIRRFRGMLSTPTTAQIPPRPTRPATKTKPEAPPTPPPPTPKAGDLKWILEAGSDAAVDREISQRYAQKRNQVLASRLKALYKHRCMACGNSVIVALDPERLYAEAAHIRPLGKPHDGPDKAGNLLVLCPVHHLQFDRGVISLEKFGTDVRFVSRIPSDPIHLRIIKLRSSHTLDADCVRWHVEAFANVGK